MSDWDVEAIFFGCAVGVHVVSDWGVEINFSGCAVGFHNVSEDGWTQNSWEVSELLSCTNTENQHRPSKADWKDKS